MPKASIILMLLAGGLSACAPHIHYSEATPTDTASRWPVISTVGSSGGTVHVAWEESGALGYGIAEMGSPLVTQASPMGTTAIGANVPDFAVSLATSGSRVYIAAEGRGAGNDRTYFVTSANGGASFTPVKSLSNVANRVSSVRVAGHGDNVSVVWIEEFSTTPGNPRTIAFVASSTDGGQTFGTAVNLGGEMQISSNVRVTAYQDLVNVAWCRTQPIGGADLFLRRSEDAGGTFGPQQLIDDNVSLCGNNHLQQVQQKVYAIWLGGNPANSERDILVAASLDGGANFQPSVDISRSSTRATQGALAAVGDNVYVVWEQVVTAPNGSNSTDVFYSRSTNNARTFSLPENLSVGNLDRESTVPAITAHGKYVHVLWDDAAFGDFDVFYRRSNNNGASFNPMKMLPTSVHNPLADFSVQAASRGISLYAVWTRSQPSSADASIYYYSKRACPVLPTESGIFRCILCCN